MLNTKRNILLTNYNWSQDFLFPYFACGRYFGFVGYVFHRKLVIFLSFYARMCVHTYTAVLDFTFKTFLIMMKGKESQAAGWWR